MTNEEIISHLLHIQSRINMTFRTIQEQEEYEALEMAIKVLEQEPCEKCKYFDGNSCQHYDYKVGYTQGYEDASKRFGQEPCDDAISINAVDRFGVLNEIYEWTISGEYEQPRGTDILIKRINNIPSVTQKSGNPQPSEHFIDGVHAMGYREGYKDAQKQKSGKWERHYIRPNVYKDLLWYCSACGIGCGYNNAFMFDYCPNCGAKMESEE